MSLRDDILNKYRDTSLVVKQPEDGGFPSATISQAPEPSAIKKILSKLPPTLKFATQSIAEGLVGRGQEVDLAGNIKFDTGLLGFIRPFGIGKPKAEKVSDRIDLLKPLIDEGKITPERASEIILDVVKLRGPQATIKGITPTELILTQEEKRALRPVVIEETLDKVFGTLDFFFLGTLKLIARTAAQRIAKSKSVNEIIDILTKEIPDLADEVKPVFGRALVDIDNADDVQTVINRTILAVQKAEKARAGVVIPKELEPLAQEARKFKTAEEFVVAEKSFGREVGVTKREVPIKELKFNQTQFNQASKDVTAGKIAKTKEPIDILFDTSSGEFRVMDGHHRLIKAIDEKKKTIPATIFYGEHSKTGLFSPDVETLLTKSQLTDFFKRAKGAAPVKRPPTARRILGEEPPRKITREEPVLLRERIRAEARGARVGIAQFKREQKFLEGLKRDITRELEKPKGKQRSTIAFIKQLGEFKQTVIADIKTELNIGKPLSKMNLEELVDFVGKMKERLKFKQERGFRPSPETIEKLGIRAPESKQPVIPDEIYKANIVAQDVRVGTKIKDVIQKARDEVDKTLGTISSRLADIDPILRTQLRQFVFTTNQRTIKDKKAIVPLLEKFKKMSKEDDLTFDFAAKNGDINKQKELIAKYGMEKEMTATRSILNDTFERANDVGFDIGYRKNYFPRIIKDPEGMVKFFSEADSEVKSIIDEAIKRKELDLARALTTNEKAYLINNMIRGYSGGQITLAPIGNMKNRIIDFVTPELNNFYFHTSTALPMYIDSVNRAVEARKFFGKTRIVDKKVDQFNNIDDSIGAYVLDLLAKGKITPKQELELREILNAFFGEKGTRGTVSLYKNLAYLDVMGSPINALTQIGDLAFPVYNAAVGNAGTFDTIGAFFRAIFGKSKITRADIGIEKIATEFESTSKSADAVDFVFKLIGLTKIDTIGKETLINPIVARFQRLAKNPTPEFTKEVRVVFEDEAQQVMKELASGEITENVKFLAFYKLLDFQPVAKSEVPQRYLTGGNLRILYQLKTWTLKMFDVFRNEGFRKMETNKAEGIRNIIILAMSLVMMNATADEIKDLVLGRKTSLKDTLIDNIAILVGFSRYSVNQIARDGLGQTAKDIVLPPTQAIDNISKDLVKIYKDWDKGVEVSKLKTFKSIPVGGDLYYWWFGKGSEFRDKTKATESPLSRSEILRKFTPSGGGTREQILNKYR